MKYNDMINFMIENGNIEELKKLKEYALIVSKLNDKDSFIENNMDLLTTTVYDYLKSNKNLPISVISISNELRTDKIPQDKTRKGERMVFDLISLTEEQLLKLRRIGPTALEEIKEILAKDNLHLNTEISNINKQKLLEYSRCKAKKI